MTAIFNATAEYHQSLDTAEEVAKTLLTPQALSPSRLAVTNAISCASVVLLSGYFESYLKDLIKEYIESINALAKPLSAIPYTMRRKHYAGGAEALVWASKRDKELQTLVMSQDLSRRLASLSNVSGYVLAWEAFANTNSNPGTETVSTLLSGLEIEKGWKAIHDLNSEFGPLDAFLTAFMKLRNVCAHTGRHSTPPSGADLLDYIEKFRKLSECIEMAIAVRLDQFATA
jgi:hypothetical protein